MAWSNEKQQSRMVPDSKNSFGAKAVAVRYTKQKNARATKKPAKKSDKLKLVQFGIILIVKDSLSPRRQSAKNQRCAEQPAELRKNL